MAFVVASDGSASVVNGLLTYTLFAVFLAPFVVAIALWRSRRASRRDGVPGTPWATAALVTVRFIGGYLLIGFLLLSFNGTGNHVEFHGDRLKLEDGYFDDFGRLQQQQRLTITVDATHSLALCPAVKQGRPVPGRPEAQYYPEQNCWARRALNRDVNGVEIGDWSMRKVVIGPSASVGRTMTALALLSLLFFGIAVFAIERILRQTAARRPFARSNVGWLQVLAIGVTGLGILAPLLQDWYVDGLVEQYFGEYTTRAFVDGTFPVVWGPAVAVVLILVLAEIWRFGISLQEDVEATV